MTTSNNRDSIAATIAAAIIEVRAYPRNDPGIFEPRRREVSLVKTVWPRIAKNASESLSRIAVSGVPGKNFPFSGIKAHWRIVGRPLHYAIQRQWRAVRNKGRKEKGGRASRPIRRLSLSGARLFSAASSAPAILVRNSEVVKLEYEPSISPYRRSLLLFHAAIALARPPCEYRIFWGNLGFLN